ncbi:tumor necrosis factor receptor superfamily member 4 isoform X3 [Symphalangus syndactylus]|uniref:tumor necrosis factor receptor superfamily member 4 isoform X3 n=1 Tax=Symphalangus syndactylus TaxID=9590 RepID=UPI0030072216
MCVGARRLGRGPCVALLLLGLGLSTATRLHCVGDTYPSNDRCCNECRPGNGMVSRCSRSQNTVCRPCGPGYYNDVVSSKPCKSCTWCNLRSGSERKQPCTATQDTVCRCRAGTQPLDSYKPGVAAPWLGSTHCSRPAIARTPSVRTGTPQPRSPRRPRAPRPGPPLSSPLKPGREPHRDPPPGPWMSLGGEAVSGPPSKRSRPTPTPPWPRSDLGPPRWTLGPARLEPGGSAGRAGQVQAARPATLQGQLRAVPGAAGCLRLSAYVCHAYLLPRGTTIKTLADGSL